MRAAHHHSDATAALPVSAVTAPRHHQPGVFFPEVAKRSGNYTVTQTTLQKADALPAGLQLRHLGLAAGCAQCPGPARLLWQCPLNPSPDHWPINTNTLLLAGNPKFNHRDVNVIAIR